MFANIKNGQMVNRSFIYQSKTKSCEAFLKILWAEGYIVGYKVDPQNNQRLQIFLKYKNGRPVINSLRLISKPSLRIHYSIKQIWKLDSSKSFIIFSTDKGLKSILDCKRLNIGGQPLLGVN